MARKQPVINNELFNSESIISILFTSSEVFIVLSKHSTSLNELVNIVVLEIADIKIQGILIILFNAK